MEFYFCPSCGKLGLHTIESTEPDPAGEYKDVCNCEGCNTLFYVIRHENEPSEEDKERDCLLNGEPGYIHRLRELGDY